MKTIFHHLLITSILLVCLIPILSACQQLNFFILTPTPLPSLTSTQTYTSTLTLTATITSTPTLTPLATSTLTITPTLTPSDTPTITNTPTVSVTPSITPSPTFTFPEGVVNVGQANCRYGPGTAYLYSHGLYQNDHVMVHGRNYSGTWLLVKPDNLDRHCWAAASVFDITGDVMRVTVQTVTLPKTTFTGPPRNITTSRTDNQVSIFWEPDTPLSEDKFRGYLLEVNVCQDGVFFWMALQTNNTSITIQDDQNCSAASNGLLYTAEKHGYSDPINIPWP